MDVKSVNSSVKVEIGSLSDASDSFSRKSFRHTCGNIPYCGRWFIRHPALRAFINLFRKRSVETNGTSRNMATVEIHKARSGTKKILLEKSVPFQFKRSEKSSFPVKHSGPTLHARVEKNLSHWTDSRTDDTKLAEWIIKANGWDEADEQAEECMSTSKADEPLTTVDNEFDQMHPIFGGQIPNPRIDGTSGDSSSSSSDEFWQKTTQSSASTLPAAINQELTHRPSLILGSAKRRLDENDLRATYMKDLWMQRANAVQDLLNNIDNSNELIQDLQQIVPRIKGVRFWKTTNKTSEERFQSYEKKLINFIAGHLLRTGSQNNFADAKIEAKKQYRLAIVDHLNRKEWKVITNSIEYNGQNYTIKLTPAAQIRRGGHNIFEKDYEGRGVSSGSSNCVEHATNLWLCELRGPDGEILFQGMRTGVLSAYGLEYGSADRQQGAINRAKEVLTGALAQQADLLQEALDGKTVHLPIVSTSLLTPLNFGKQREGEMLSDQMHAWSQLARQETVALNIRDSDGNLKTVHVKPEIAAFNFGVNEIAQAGRGIPLLPLIDKILDRGWDYADSFNLPAMKTLLGPLNASSPGGMVGRFLSLHPESANADLVRELTKQIIQMWNDKSYRRDENEVYKMTTRIDMLSHLIGVPPHWNCKSGKDRTAANASEILRTAIQLHQGEALQKPGTKLNPQQQALLRKTMIDSGNVDVQIMNTAAPGNKVMKNFVIGFLNLSHKERIGGKDAFREAMGLSKVVKA